VDVRIVGAGHRHQTLVGDFPHGAEEAETQVLRRDMRKELGDGGLVSRNRAAHFEAKPGVGGKHAFHRRHPRIVL